MRYAFETFLRLYPAPYRIAFGGEMASVFAEASRDCRERGFMAYLSFLFAEFFGVIGGALMEWSEEYVRRSARRFTARFVFSVIVGTAFTLYYQGCFYAHMPRIRGAAQPTRAAVPADPQHIMGWLVLWGGLLLFVGVFSIAFVWNMRVIGTRAGRLDPIWMPGMRAGRAGRRGGKPVAPRRSMAPRKAMAPQGRTRLPQPIYGLEK